uniref:Solute carrier family 43 member 3b n=1 Tax=Neolamprologus brichardi TaxID=32507 RepID=A0A3Q4GCL5_NEOBR
MPGSGSGVSVQRCLTFTTGLVECLCFAGAVFGWASLVFVLKEEGYFSSLCVNGTGINGTYVLGHNKINFKMDEQFSLIFTIASFMNNFLTLPNGFLFDRFGTTVTRLYGICYVFCFFFSFLVLAILLFPALALLAVGGILFLMTNMQVGNLFGSRRSTIITLYNGAFDSSSALFLVIKLLHERGIALRSSFLFLSACSVIHLLRTFFLLPRKLIPYPLPDNYTYGYESTADVTDESALQVQSDASAKQVHLSTVIFTYLFAFFPHLCDLPSLSEKSFRDCLLSRFFMWHLLWLSVMQLRHYLFIGTLNPMLQRLTAGESSLGNRTNTTSLRLSSKHLNVILLNQHALGESEQEVDLRATVLSLFLTALQCLLFSICASTPYLPLQYLTFVLQVLNRSFLYGGNAAFISVAFPSCHFGKLYGLVMALSAVFSLLQYPCFALVKVLDGDPLYVNIGLTLLSLLAFIHPLSVYLHCRSVSSQRVKNKSKGPTVWL